MTIKQATFLEELTQEQKAELAVANPKLFEAAMQGGTDAALRAWYANWSSARDVQTEAEKQAVEIRKEVAAAPAEQGSLLHWCGFPTDMTRVSPFFPMQANELGQRTFMRDVLITSAAWGEIHYTGPKLSVYEEDALLAILAMLQHVSTHRKESQIDDRKTYTYTGPLLPLWRLMYGSKTKTGKEKKPSSSDYKRLIASLKLLSVAGVQLSISAGKTKSGKKREPRYSSMSAMLSNVALDIETKTLSVTVNPFFYETYIAGTVTLMDVQKRMDISGSIAKSLYRFVTSHSYKEPLWSGHYLTLAQALNMDTEQPAKKLREHIKAAISELARHSILDKKSRLLSSDIVTLYLQKQNAKGHRATRRVN